MFAQLSVVDQCWLPRHTLTKFFPSEKEERLFGNLHFLTKKDSQSDPLASVYVCSLPSLYILPHALERPSRFETELN